MTWFEVKSLLDFRMLQNRKRNVVYFGLNESKAHALKKMSECYDLLASGHDFYTEAVFQGGKGRADILAWNSDGDVFAVEVVHSEDETKSGKEKYPCSVRFVYTKGI